MAASRALLSNPHATASPTTTRAQARLRSAILSAAAPVASSEPARRISRSGSDGALRPKPAVLRQFADVEECAYGMCPAELLAKHLVLRIHRDAATGDASMRSQIHNESAQLGVAMQHLCAMFLELGRTMMMLRMGPSPSELL